MLESFEPEGVLGRGGMGRVFAARHRATGHRVAIKVQEHGSAAARANLEREVRVVAAMDHPHIVRIYDQGTSTAPWADVPVGTPFFVMQQAASTLAGHVPGAWHDVRDLLLATLEALAHAHARGVVHRDVKPSNLLFLPGVPNGERLRVADFGIAWTNDMAARMAGTPGYMAPEQIAGGELGPWTDLYGLGCVAWHLLSDAPPFGLSPTDDVLTAHLSAPLPRLAARIPLPDGVEDWLRAMLARAPATRFQRAADALHALHLLDQGIGSGLTKATAWSDATIDATRTTDGAPLPAPTAGDERPAPPPAPFTPHWRQPDPTPLDRTLEGLGLHLVGLRDPALVGRAAEQQRLWDLLARAHAGEAVAIGLDGPPGVGTSRLARWLAERAHELGLATRADLGEERGDRAHLCWFDGHAPATLPDAPGTLVVLTGVADHPAPRHPVAPLGPIDTANLVRDLLGLDPVLGTRLEEEAAGRPGVLVGRVQEWARAGRLAPGPHGYTLRDGTPQRTEDDLDAAVAAAEHFAISEYPRHTLRWTTAARRIALAQALDPADPRWGEIEAIELEARADLGEAPALEGLAAEVLQRARHHNWHRSAGRVLCYQAQVHKFHARFHESDAAFAQAVDAFAAAGDAYLEGFALTARARVLMVAGDRTAGRTLLERALARFEESDHPAGTAIALRHLAVLDDEAGLHASAAATARRALDLLGRGWPQRRALLWTTLGHALRNLGQPDQAALAFEQSCALFEGAGSMESLMTRVNLGMCELDRGRWSTGRQKLDTAFDRMLRVTGGRLLQSMRIVSALQLAASAAEGDRAAVALHLDRVRGLEVANPYAAEWVGRASEFVDDPLRTELVDLAVDHWRRLGREDRAASLTR